MHRFVRPSQAQYDATHRSFRVNVLHVIYTRHHHQHHHPRHHNHHHRWITLYFGSDSIDSRWRRCKSHGVNNKCSSNYSTRLTLFSICIINKSFYYNANNSPSWTQTLHWSGNTAGGCAGLIEAFGLQSSPAFLLRVPYTTHYMFIYAYSMIMQIYINSAGSSFCSHLIKCPTCSHMNIAQVSIARNDVDIAW